MCASCIVRTKRALNSGLQAVMFVLQMILRRIPGVCTMGARHVWQAPWTAAVQPRAEGVAIATSRLGDGLRQDMTQQMCNQYCLNYQDAHRLFGGVLEHKRSSDDLVYVPQTSRTRAASLAFGLAEGSAQLLQKPHGSAQYALSGRHWEVCRCRCACGMVFAFG